MQSIIPHLPAKNNKTLKPQVVIPQHGHTLPLKILLIENLPQTKPDCLFLSLCYNSIITREQRKQEINTMKKTVLLITLLSLVLGLCGCGLVVEKIMEQPANTSTPTIPKPSTSPPATSFTPLPGKEILPATQNDGSPDGPEEVFPFGPDDDELMGISLWDSDADVRATLGIPVEILSDFNIHLGEDQTVYLYGFGEVRLNANGVYAIYAYYNNSALGPRGIRIGDRLEDIIQKFPLENYPDLNSSEESMLYGDDYADERGYFYSSEDFTSILYAYGPPGFGSVGLTLEFEFGLLTQIGMFAAI